jgi:two-component system, OmpR family, KDP operon response regulator KdpE
MTSVRVLYVTKPFGMDKLLVQLRAAVRRAQPAGEGQAIVETEAFTIDVTARKATHRSHEVRLTPTE